LVPWTVRNASAFHQFVPVTTETGYALAGTYNATIQNRHVDPALWVPPVTQMRQVWAAHPLANEAQVSSHLTSMALHYIRRHPGSLAHTAWWNLLRLLNITGPGVERAFAGGEGYPAWLAQASVYAFWVAGVLALLGAFTAAARRAPAAMWLAPVLILLSAMFLLGLTRYRSPADPFVLFLATLGVLSLVARARAALGARASLASPVGAR
jgi:hypothetical protein